MSLSEEILSRQRYPAKEHVQKVIACLKSKVSSVTGILYLESQKTQLLEDSDEPVHFRQRRHFYYVTGCELPDCSFTYDIESGQSTLLIPPADPDEVMWQGLPMTAAEAAERYEVDAVLTTDSINAHLASKPLNKSKVWTIKDQVSPDVTFLSYDETDFLLLKAAIDEARVTKTAYEIALLARANRISSAAHETLMRNACKASNERELHALFLQQCVANGLPDQAYPSIVAGGENAATLHYMKNSASLTGKLNVLVDAGAESSCYGADITRVTPLSAKTDSTTDDDSSSSSSTAVKFTPASRAIYSIVLQMQEAAFAMLQPGAAWPDIHAQSHRVLIRGLLSLGILRAEFTEQEHFEARTSVAFFPHGLGHLLGLDTHDTGGQPDFGDADPMFRYLRLKRPRGLEEGHVVTVEPGCYFCRFIVQPYLKDGERKKYFDEEVIEGYWDVGGVRIEDNVVITKDGYVNLTTAAKEIDDVERLANGG